MPGETLPCSNCGGKIERPAGFTRPKIRCPDCGYYAATPPAWRDDAEPEAERRPRRPSVSDDTDADETPRKRPRPAPEPESRQMARPVARPPAPKAPPAKAPAAKRRANPRDSRPDFTPDEPGGAPLLAGTTDADDDQPYAVPGTGLKRCKFCHGELPLSATFCVHCGQSLDGRRAAERVHQPMDGAWGEGLPLPTRLAILAGLLTVDVLLSLMLLVTTTDIDIVDIVTQGGFQLFHVALQVFLIGSFDTLLVRRDSRNRTTLTRVRRIGFIPMGKERIDWKVSTHVGTVGAHETGLFTWYIFGYLLLAGCLPGILFYFWSIRPDRHLVRLCDEYGSTDEVVFRTKDRDEAMEVCEFIAEATGLHYRAT